MALDIRISSLEQDAKEGDSPVCGEVSGLSNSFSSESGCLVMQP